MVLIWQKENDEYLTVLVSLKENLLGRDKPTGPVCGQTGKPQNTGAKYHTGWPDESSLIQTLSVGSEWIQVGSAR
jgi:hypothetical protein